MNAMITGLMSRSSSRTARPLLVIAAVTCVGLALAVATPYLSDGAALEHDIAQQVRATTGLALQTTGNGRFGLWPQPHVSLDRLHLADPSGTLTIDAEAFSGDVRLLPLLVGRIEVASVTLDRPKLRIDLDGPPMPADSMIGHALRNGEGESGGTQRLGVVSLVDGTAFLKRRASVGALIKDINVTIDWRNLDAPATLTGLFAVHGIPTDVSAWVAKPSSLLHGDHSAIAIRLRGAPFNLTANGDLASNPHFRFHGRVSAEAAQTALLLQMAGYGRMLPAPFADVRLKADAVVDGDNLDLSDLRLRADGNDFEGSLAFRGDGVKPSLAGTLASNQLSLTPFFGPDLRLMDGADRWSTNTLRFEAQNRLALDLRVSAAHLRIPPLAVDDAALAIMTRDDRLEIGLVEGKAYGGGMRAHVSFGTVNDVANVRASGSITDADASALSWGLLGRQVATGTLSATTNLEATGPTVDAMIRDLRGAAGVRAGNGELSTVDISHGLREIARGRLDALLPALRNGSTAFQSAGAAVQINDGVATIDKATLTGPDADLKLEGSADLGLRRFDLHGVAKPPSGTPNAASPTLAFVIRGPMAQPIVEPDLSLLLRPTNGAAPRP